MRFFVFAITALLSGMSVFSQESSAEEQNQSWYLSGSYSTAVWSSDYWVEDFFSQKSDAVVSHDNPRFKDFNNYSLGIGLRNGRFQTDLIYENFGTVRWVVGTTVDRTPRTYDSGEMQIESTNLMLQLSYDLYEYDKGAFFVTAGVGQSEHHVDTAILNISGIQVEYADPSNFFHTSLRGGFGLRYPVSDKASLETRLNYSDYGMARVYDASTGYASYAIKMQAVEAGISLKYYF